MMIVAGQEELASVVYDWDLSLTLLGRECQWGQGSPL